MLSNKITISIKIILLILTVISTSFFLITFESSAYITLKPLSLRVVNTLFAFLSILLSYSLPDFKYRSMSTYIIGIIFGVIVGVLWLIPTLIVTEGLGTYYWELNIWGFNIGLAIACLVYFDEYHNDSDTSDVVGCGCMMTVFIGPLLFVGLISDGFLFEFLVSCHLGFMGYLLFNYLYDFRTDKIRIKKQ